MMKNKLLILILGAALLAASPVLGSPPEQSWKWQREIKIDDSSRFNRFEISPEIYTKAELSLGDLRIVDGQGAPVPYILDKQRKVTESALDYRFKLNRTFRTNTDTSFDFEGEVPAGTDLILNHLTASIGFESDFFKYVEIHGSYDGTHWDWIGNDTLYRVDGTTDNVLSLSSPLKYSFYRIVILDNGEGVTLNGLSGSLNTASEKLSNRKIIFSSDQFQRVEAGTSTEIRLKGFRNLPVRTLSIEAEGLFHRQCRLIPGDKDTVEVFGNGYLYQSTLKNTEPLKNSLPVSITHPYDTLALVLENGDNPPLKIQTITLEYAADTLIFEPAKNTAYYLQYGNSSALTPQYDLEQFRNEITQQDIGTAVLLSESQLKEPDKASTSPISQKTIFSAVIFLVAVLLAWFAIRGMKKG